MTHVHQEVFVRPMLDDAPRDALQDCIEECLNCHVVCTTAVQHCLVAGGELSDQSLVGVLLDCAEMAQVSANFMVRGSPYAMVTAAACAELCRTAEEACRAADDERLRECAEACAACAGCCERIEEPAIV
jgi:hypothetical protein